MSQIRNQPGKPGRKPAPRRVGVGDPGRVAEQWEAAVGDVEIWERAVKKHGRTARNRFGDVVASAPWIELGKARDRLRRATRLLLDAGLAEPLPEESGRGVLLEMVRKVEENR